MLFAYLIMTIKNELTSLRCDIYFVVFALSVTLKCSSL